VSGFLLYYCSHFRAYIQTGRCEGERRLAGVRPEHIGKQAFRIVRNKNRVGRDSAPLEGGLDRLDMLAACAERTECLTCPGVVKRSLRELKQGELA
jgi:hypothetical protein